MGGRLQYFVFFLIILSFCILHGVARPLNTLVMMQINAEQKQKSTFIESSIPKMVERNSTMKSHRQKKNITRKLEVNIDGPSPDGPGHHR
ncbi:hypothetical protein Lal_00000254 [Lupinus albus]|nr:hypothetical protein Lal_00000254 [Lupinus albus]